jgi:hypothetical protein
MFPFIFVGFVTIPFILTLAPKTESMKVKLGRVDWTGGALFISSSTSFLIAISWGGTMEPWGSFRTLVPLVMGLLGLIATGFWETYYAKEPFLGRRLFYCRDSFAAYTGALLQGFLVFELVLMRCAPSLTLSAALRYPLLRSSVHARYQGLWSR